MEMDEMRIIFLKKTLLCHSPYRKILKYRYISIFPIKYIGQIFNWYEGACNWEENLKIRFKFAPSAT
jgi:hypothetical protein